MLSMHSVVYATVRQCIDESCCYLCTVVDCATARQCMDESCYLCTVSFMLQYDSVRMSPGVVCAVSLMLQCMDESCCYLCTVSFMLQYDSVWMSLGVFYAQCCLCYCTAVYG